MRQTTTLEARPTLVVVDCQAGCRGNSRSETANRTADAAIGNIAELCRNSVRGGEQIVLVECEGFGETDPEVLKAIRWSRRIVRIKKDRSNVLDTMDPNFPHNLAVLSPLREIRATVRLVGFQASDCVANSTCGLHRYGILCRALAHGILDHAADASWSSYRAHNDLDRIREFYYDAPGRMYLLDESRMREDNLVELHARRARERMAALLSA